LLSGMCPEGTQCRQGSLDAPDATRCGAWEQDAQDAESRLVESGCNTTVSDAGHLFVDIGSSIKQSQCGSACTYGPGNTHYSGNQC